MSTLLSLAQGKVMIAGEYAVLMAKDAIVATIDREVYCRYQAGPERFWTKMGSDNFVLDNDAPLYQAVKQSCHMAGLSLAKGEYYLDSSKFFNHGHKIGLGSSAAATVALCQIAFLQHELSDNNRLFSIAQKAHQSFNTPNGSGADIAAAISGGAIIFNTKKRICRLPNLYPSIHVITTGRSQSSADFLKHFFAFDAHKLKDFAHQSQKIVLKLAKHPNSFPTIKESFAELYNLLKHLGEQLACPIVSKEHEIIAEIARFYNGAAKPSGAGGGDIALAVVPQDQQASFQQELNNYGFSLLSTKLSNLRASASLK